MSDPLKVINPCSLDEECKSDMEACQQMKAKVPEIAERAKVLPRPQVD